MLSPLEGFVVGVTADRRADEQADLLVRRGAHVLHGPVIHTLPLGPDDDLRDATARVIEHRPHYVIANTGIGIRGWVTAAAAWGWDETLTSALGTARVLARGPKAAGALHALGVEVWWRAPRESLAEVLDRLLAEPLTGRTVAFQLHGDDTPEVTAAIRAAGARVIEVPVYRWQLPEERGAPYALIERVCNGDVDAVTFTTGPAVENFLELARERGRETAVRDALNARVIAAVIGPYCATVARSLGLDAFVEPVASRLGSMVRALTDRLAGERVVVRKRNQTMVVQGRAVEVRETQERVLWLTTRERWLLDCLLRRHGAVATRSELGRAVWGAGTDDHLLDVTVGRLRRRLGAAGELVETVPKRGYRVTGEVTA
ncbi:MAG TPA: uroporphyrinogen-III synthase [Acidimicrobiia bacterium]|nr:uroporphyrinogen-III synthase [Acidimicrobiia bacterium]